MTFADNTTTKTLVNRMKDSIDKVKQVVGMIDNAQQKQQVISALNTITNSYNLIVQNNYPCPLEMVGELTGYLDTLDSLYLQYFSN